MKNTSRVLCASWSTLVVGTPWQRRVQNTCEHSERINGRMRYLIICQLFLHRNAVLTGKCSRLSELWASRASDGKLFSSYVPITWNRFNTLTSFPTPSISYLFLFKYESTLYNFSSLIKLWCPKFVLISHRDMKS